MIYDNIWWWIKSKVHLWLEYEDRKISIVLWQKLVYLLPDTYILCDLNPPFVRKVVCTPFQDSALLFMWP